MRKSVATAGCVVFIASAAVACGTAENISAGTKAQRAVEKLNEQKAVTITGGFDGTESQIWSAMKGEDDFTHDSAKMLADLEISVSLSSKTSLKDATEGKGAKAASSALSLSTGGKSPLLEVRSLAGKKYYVRADLEQLMSLASDTGAGGGDDADSKAELKQFQAMLDQADKLPSSYKSVKDLLGGKWVSIDPDAFSELSEQFGAGTSGSGSGSGSGSSTDALDAKTQQKIVKAVTKAVGSNATFKNAGSEDGVDHVTATVPAAKTADALSKALKPYEDELPGGFDPDDLKDAPKKNIGLDLAIKDGMLSGVTIDIAQLDDKATGELPMTIGFSADAEPVRAPAGATTLNPQDVMGAVMQLMMGDLSKD